MSLKYNGKISWETHVAAAHPAKFNLDINVIFAPRFRLYIDQFEIFPLCGIVDAAMKEVRAARQFSTSPLTRSPSMRVRLTFWCLLRDELDDEGRLRRGFSE